VTDKGKTPAAAIFVAWFAVSIPAAWGVYNTVLNALKLFQHPAAVSAPQTGPSHAK
jgi:hypothetical protein